MKNPLPSGGTPLHELIATRQRALELSDVQLAQATGLSIAVLGMIKSGHMMLPVGKIAVLARLLELPAEQTLVQYLDRNAPDYLQAMQDCGLWSRGTTEPTSHSTSLHGGQPG